MRDRTLNPILGWSALLIWFNLGASPLARADVMTQPTRTFGLGPLTHVALSPDGERVVTVGNNINLWDRVSGKLLKTGPTASNLQYGGLTFSPDSKRVLAVYWSASILVWDTINGDVTRSFPGRVNGAIFSPDGKQVLVEYQDEPPKLFDATTGELARSFSGAGFIYGFSPDSERVLLGAKDPSSGTNANDPPIVNVSIWDAKTGQIQLTLTNRVSGPRTVAFSPDGTRVVTLGAGTGLWPLSLEASLSLWNASTGEKLLTLGTTNDLYQAATFSPDGTRLLTRQSPGLFFDAAGSNLLTALWDTATGQRVCAYECGGNLPAAVFSPDGRKVLISFGQYWDWSATSIQLYEAETGRVIRNLPHARADVFFLAFTPDGQEILTAAGSLNFALLGDERVQIWDTATGVLKRSLVGHYRSLLSAAISPDGTKVVTGSSHEGQGCLWDAGSGQVLADLGYGALRGAQFSADGAKALVPKVTRPEIFTTESTAVRDANTGAILLNFASNDVASAVMSAGGSRVAIQIIGQRYPHDPTESAAVFWDANTGKELRRFTAPETWFAGDFTGLSQDGSKLIMAGTDGVARLWDTVSGQLITAFFGHRGSVNAAVLSGDERHVLTGGTDGTAQLWDAATGQSLGVFTGHTGEVTCVTFLADGNKIMTGGKDNTARIWDVPTGQLLRVLAGHSPYPYSGVDSISCTADGTKVVTTSHRDPAYLWDISDLFPKLTLEKDDGQWLLRWPAGTLQQRAPAEPSWTDVPAATNPFPLNLTAPSRLYRLKRDL